MTTHEPGPGKTPSERRVDIDAAPLPDDIAALFSRPLKNTQEIGAPDIHQARHVAPIPAAPIVDIGRLGPQVPQGGVDADDRVIFRDLST